MEAVRLNFTSPLHLGRGREELDKTELIYHSDSLKSALYSVGISLFKEWKDPEYFFHGFKISSCFPFAKDEYFFPRPNIRKKLLFSEQDNDHLAKRIKKIEYLSKVVFEQVINDSGNTAMINENHLTADGLMVCERESTCLRTDDDARLQRISFFVTDVQQRVAVPPVESGYDPRPFYIDRIYFEEGCGLFFLANFETETIRNQVLTALKILGDTGIGTDRTVGNGMFSFDKTKDCNPFSFSLSELFKQQMPLGLFLPTEEEAKNIDLSTSSWNLLKRGGYMGGSEKTEWLHLQKKSIYMFGEGSVFTTTSDLHGKYEDLKPEWDPPMHPVWRCGMPVFIKI